MNAHVDHSQFQQIVAGLSEGVILIDLDRTLVYANAAALAMHGVQWLSELGESVAEYRENFQLRYRNHHTTGPHQHPVDRLVAGETFKDVVVEVRQVRAPARVWMHRVRSLITVDAAGAPEMFALILQDVSERFEAEERFEDMFRANPAPALICRIADLRYVKVNQGFLDLTGYERGDVLGRSIAQIDILRDADRRALALERLHAGRTIRQMEACLAVPSDGEKHVIVAGHPIEMPGGERCMLFTFADLEDHCRAEQALRLSEERFAKAFQLSPVPTALLSSGTFVPSTVNEAFAATFGAPAGEGSGQLNIRPAIWTDAGDQENFRRTLEREGCVRGFEARLRAGDGEEFDAVIAAEVVTINGEACVLCAFQDVTARRRNEVELIAAIEAVMADASWFSHGVVEKLAHLRNPQVGKPRAFTEKLTSRECDVMAGICRGTSDAQMARDLGLSLNTVRNHVASLYRKLGVNRRSAVVVWARDRGIGETLEPLRGTSLKPVRKD